MQIKGKPELLWLIQTHMTPMANGLEEAEQAWLE
jgi:hypothetical protein